MSDHEARFREFHANNPEVYKELVDLARTAISKGKKKIGIRMLWEVMRWNRFLVTNDESQYKLNDHYHSRYARLIMRQEPDLSSIFELRELKTSTITKDDIATADTTQHLLDSSS
jgi:hypothetical protein